LRPQLRARQNDAGEAYELFAYTNGKSIAVKRFERATVESAILGEFALREALQPGQDYELELRAVGPRLTAKLNGKTVGTVTDGALTIGRFGARVFDRNGTSTLIKSLEFLHLAAPAGASVAAPAAEPWQDLVGDPAKLELSRTGVERTPEGLRFTDTGMAMLQRNLGPQRDGAVRMRTTFGGLRPQLRARAGDAGKYQLTPAGTKVKLERYDNSANRWTALREFPLPEPLKAGEDYELELRVVGQTITAKFNGEVLGTVADMTLAAGRFGVGVSDRNEAPGLLKTFEVLDLDAPAATSTPPIAPPASIVPPGQWVPVFTKFEDLPSDLRQSGNSLKWEDGWIRLGGIKRWINLPKILTGNYGVRLRFRRHDKPEEHAVIALRIQEKHSLYYALKLGSSTLNCVRSAEPYPSTQELFNIPCPTIPKVGEEGTLEFYVIGTQLIGRSGPAFVSIATDDHYAQGRSQVIGSEDLRDLEVINLEGLSTPDALKLAGVDEQVHNVRTRGPTSAATAATKDAPFVNSLGMKFVSVPIVGGPTDGKPVLFSIWETRTQDYGAFVTETERPWPKQGAGQGPKNPAVMVSWEDTQVFCAWLTERERQAGNIGAGDQYRLPSDHEWSCAVGIGEREDAASPPADKSSRIPDEFPWGTAWPPPTSAGNYAGEEWRADMAAGTAYVKGFIEGYTDPYMHNASVGSFRPNAFGLYDLGGNVWELCSDWRDRNQTQRVLRGGSRDNWERTAIASSYRGSYNASKNLQGGVGFRVVLAPAP
jgi:hypothetical protein